MSYSPAPLIQSITSVASHWRFTPAKLSLLCQRAKIILKLQKYTFQLPQYRFTTLPYSSLYKKFPIHKLPKANESTPQHYFNHFIQHHFSQVTPIFTNRSRSQLGTGAAVWIPSSSTSLSLSLISFTSIFHAEQLAISTALHHIRTYYSSGSFLIISDSLSALQSINSLPLNTGPSLAPPIILILNTTPHLSFNFLWIPSHFGISHNEKADSLAKNAILSSSPFKLLATSDILSVT